LLYAAPKKVRSSQTGIDKLIFSNCVYLNPRLNIEKEGWLDDDNWQACPYATIAELADIRVSSGHLAGDG
jgi:hypothetical protein